MSIANTNNYFELTRKYVTILGLMLSNIKIVRTNDVGEEQAVIDVPVTYAGKDKMLVRVLQDPNIDKQAAIILPIISFELESMSYAAGTKLNTSNRIKYKSDANNARYMWNFVPYDFVFKAYIYVKNTEDGTKIIEQILPNFTPDWTVKAKLIPEMEEAKDIPVTLTGVGFEHKYDGDFKNRPTIIWKLDFTLKGYLYGPEKISPIIKFTNTNFLPLGGSANSKIASISGRPGMTSNNQPTVYAANSIPATEIEATDDFGYITTRE